MHFGYYRAGMNPVAREAMLERMNEEVLLRLDAGRPDVRSLLDMGCGVGATARHAAASFPDVHVTGISIVPSQIERARELTAQASMGDRVDFLQRDYQATGFAAASFDGAYALESSCHAPGAGKEGFLREAHRILRPGGRLVVTDAFLKHAESGALKRRLLARACRCWVIERWAELDVFRAALEDCGFENIRVENLRWRVAPSAMHVPWVTVRFLFREWIVKRSRLSPERWNNVAGPTLAMLLAMPGGPLGYYMVSATKRRL
jgi:MPBQ/MSBQ methyltransferase